MVHWLRQLWYLERAEEGAGRVRSDERYKDIPVVIITTEGGEEDRKRALALGANAYITKPIRAPQVIQTVRQLLGV